jgi:hypothetical protein
MGGAVDGNCQGILRDEVFEPGVFIRFPGSARSWISPTLPDSDDDGGDAGGGIDRGEGGNGSDGGVGCGSDGAGVASGCGGDRGVGAVGAGVSGGGGGLEA